MTTEGSNEQGVEISSLMEKEKQKKTSGTTKA